MLCYFMLYCIVLYCMISYHIILYYIILYYIMLCYVMLYYIILYYIYCETWVRLCQAHCQENKRNVPEFPLLTARRGGLTVHATPWSRNGAAILEAFPSSGNSAARFWGRFLAPFLGPRKSKQELLDGPDGPDFVHLLAPAFLLQCKPPWTHTSI